MVDKINPLSNYNAGSDHQLRRVSRSEPARSEDAVNLSSDVINLRGMEGIRYDKVMRLRQQFANKTYPVERNLDIALDRALDNLLESDPNLLDPQ